MKPVMKDMLNKTPEGGELHALNSLLSIEISEVEAYNEAMQRIKDVDLMPALTECRNSHALRIQILRKCIEELDGTPTDSAGFLGAISKFVESAANMLGDRTAIAVLAGGEEQCSDQYQSHLKSLDSVSSLVVEEELLPAQETTWRTMSTLRLAANM